jgi:5-methylcytosine-specific restriction endonuclease McrA
VADRNTTTRDRHRRAIARTKPPCALCGDPIDYSLKYPDPMSYVVDHIHPWKHDGPDDLSNKQAAHNTCNRQKWDHIEGEQPQARTFVTARRW